MGGTTGPNERSGDVAGAAHAPAGASGPSLTVLVPLTSFVGRERELADVRRLLADTRLLTLTGPGGVGKTRLAVQLLRELGEGAAFPDGVRFVGLAPLADAALVSHAIAATLGIREEA